jgi:branched-chain amino acid transport system ATP-binding protein
VYFDRAGLNAKTHLMPVISNPGNPTGHTRHGAELAELMAMAEEPGNGILLDEPYEGLAPVIVDEIEKTLRIIKEQGITTILVEQNAVRALQLADRAVILDTGQIVFDGTATEVLENAELRAEYLAI